MTVITKKTSEKSISRILKNIKPKKKGLDMKKFAGKLSWKGDPVAVQREMRNDR